MKGIEEGYELPREAEDDVWSAQVERVFADPRTRAAIGSFFGEWLENSTLEELDSRVGTVVFDAFRGDFEPGPDLREHMRARMPLLSAPDGELLAAGDEVLSGRFAEWLAARGRTLQWHPGETAGTARPAD